MKPIKSFSGEHAFLSNFFPCSVEFEGEIYPSSEHAYMASKTTDLNVRKQIRELDSPGKAKRLGRTIELREDWDDVRINFMRIILESKFSNKDLMARLEKTAPSILIEGNSWGDRFWGQDLEGNGHNHLGKLLMSIRDDINRKFLG